MKVVLVYKDFTDYARDVENYLRDFKIFTGRELDTLDPESTEGEIFCQTYDILEYPSIAAISNDGHLQQLWRGIPLPQISEVSYYLSQE
ncbi:hypothetical protein FWF48_01245 [Candidatus Saccharibacteria bacterium]|nr:hypothetical protein [Candidatus Saccharibacteria bacterium]